MEENKIELKIYRHKVYKDIYLIRNWGTCGSPEADWFKATKSIKDYFYYYKNYDGTTLDKAYQEKIRDKDFIYDINGKCRMTANIIIKKDFDFDGYKGKLEKELKLPIDEFELVILTEQH